MSFFFFFFFLLGRPTADEVRRFSNDDGTFAQDLPCSCRSSSLSMSGNSEDNVPLVLRFPNSTEAETNVVVTTGIKPAAPRPTKERLGYGRAAASSTTSSFSAIVAVPRLQQESEPVPILRKMQYGGFELERLFPKNSPLKSWLENLVSPNTTTPQRICCVCTLSLQVSSPWQDPTQTVSKWHTDTQQSHAVP